VKVAVGGQLRCSAVRGLDTSLLLVSFPPRPAPISAWASVPSFGIVGGWVLCVCVCCGFDGLATL
jgi:hypothetical protein